MLVLYVVDQTGNGEKSYDIYSRLLEDRIVFISGEIDDASANTVVAQLIYLEAKNPEKDICVYINSPGGSVTAGMAIYDTMKYVKCDVSTICVGLAASMGAFLLAAGTKGKRFCLPNSEVMIHQPLGGAKGQASDIEITARHIMRTKKKMIEMLSKNTGQPVKKVEKDVDRDYYMTAEEAVEYGLVDKVITREK